MGGKGLAPLLVCKTRGMAERKAVVGSIPTVPLQYRAQSARFTGIIDRIVNKRRKEL